MKAHRIKFLGIIILLISGSILLLAHKSGDDDKLNRDVLMQVIYFTIQNGHYDPGNIDDEFSKKVFDVYLMNIDFRKRYLLQSDVKKLRKFETEIDDEVKESKFNFFDLSNEILSERTEATKQYYTDILSSPFDFTIDEEIELDPDNIEFAENNNALKERWRKLLKWEVIEKIDNLKQEQEDDIEKSDTVTIKDFATLEKEARESTLQRYDDWYHRLDMLNDNDQLSVYVNSFLSILDPHTSYFPPKVKENFDIRFSGQLEGIGAQLTQKNMYVEVIKIIPGSPSWKDGRLEVGDYILKVKQEDEDQAIDIVDMRLDDAVQLIRGEKGSQVTLTIKQKIDGSITDITLTRDVVKMQETYAKSLLLKAPENDLKYGYIKLPSFYVDFDNKSNRDCFTDVKNELSELVSEGIDGLVFDVRDNSGGSLQHVVKIAGLFIEQGPVVQSKTKVGRARVLRDLDTGVMYDGPIVVMVNALSASAAEIFAAALQDYDRAIVVGGESSFGKGTVQSFTDLNSLLQSPPEGMGLGAVKLTIQKFYRIDGSSTQLKGVVPDIVMPDYYNYMEIGEKDMDYPMAWDEIDPAFIQTWVPDYNENLIVGLSQQRMETDATMQLIAENGLRLKQIRDLTIIPLNLDNYSKEMDVRESAAEKYDRIGKDTLGLEINLSKIDLLEAQSDTTSMAIADEWILDMKKDIYILETLNILKDMGASQNVNAIREKESNIMDN